MFHEKARTSGINCRFSNYEHRAVLYDLALSSTIGSNRSPGRLFRAGTNDNCNCGSHHSEYVRSVRESLWFQLGVIKGFSILIGFGYILVVISNSAIIVILGIVLTAGIGFSGKTLIMNYLNKYTPDEKRATMLSFVSMLGSLVTMILNPLVGYIADISMEDLCLTIGGILLLWAILSPIRKEYLLN